MLKTAAVLFALNHIISRIPVAWCRLFAYRKCFDLALGSNILMGVRFRYRRNLKMGKNSVINYGCTIDTRGGLVVIGEYVDVAPEVNIWTLQHAPHDPCHGAEGAPVTIEDYAWIANRAIILPGVTIGRGAVVAAGAVVTESVEPLTIVAGVPARPIGKRKVPDFSPRPPYRPLLQ